jgi:hypothetical protein
MVQSWCGLSGVGTVGAGGAGEQGSEAAGGEVNPVATGDQVRPVVGVHGEITHVPVCCGVRKLLGPPRTRVPSAYPMNTPKRPERA